MAPADEAERPTIALSSETVAEVWQQALAGLSGLLGEHAALARSVTLAAPDRLVVTFDGDYTFNKDACERPQQCAELERAVSGVAGTSVKLDFALAGGARPPSVPAPRGFRSASGWRPRPTTRWFAAPASCSTRISWT